MNNTLAQLLEPHLPTDLSRSAKDQRVRLSRFMNWLKEHDLKTLNDINLAQYRDYLVIEVGLSTATVQSHLAAIRTWLRELTENPAFHDVLLKATNPDFPESRRSEQVNAQLGHLLQVIQPSAAPIKRERAAPRNLNISDHDINEFLYGLKVDTSIALRDAAAITLMLATGIRESELCALNVSDLRQHTDDGQLVLHVPSGTGCTERFIPYLDMDWVLQIVDVWMEYAGIKEGPVFRGFYKTGNIIRPTRLSLRAVEQLLANYPISLEGQIVRLKPLNLRHAYAGHLYRMGIDVQTITEYLGVSRLETTWNYIGAKARHDYMPYEFDLSRLEGWRQSS